jgi:hypothetical protein
MNMTLKAIKIDKKLFFCLFYVYFILGPEPVINLINLIELGGAARSLNEIRTEAPEPFLPDQVPLS